MEPYNASSTPCCLAPIQARPLWQESNPRVSRRTALRRLRRSRGVRRCGGLAVPVGELMPHAALVYVAFARQSAMYLAHVAFEIELGEVGRAFGRDRTTAAHACRLIEERRDDRAVDAVLAALELAAAHYAAGQRAGVVMSARRRGLSVYPGAHRANGGGIDIARAASRAGRARIARAATSSTEVTVDEAESPLAWLARRKGRDGRALIEPVQLLAGERLRAEFTRAHLMPRITSNWSASVADRPRAPAQQTFTETVIGARERVRGRARGGRSGVLWPAGRRLLLSQAARQCRARAWLAAASAKVALQLGLDRLARHYGLQWRSARGKAAAMRTWLGGRRRVHVSVSVTGRDRLTPVASAVLASRLDAVDHGAEAVGALRREVVAQAELLEQARRRRSTGCPCAPLPEYSANRIAISPRTIWASLSPTNVEHRPAAAVRLDRGRKPHLAGAALHLVGVAAGRFRQRRQRAAELDQIAVAVVPLLQQSEILDDLVDRCHRSACGRMPSIYHLDIGCGAADVEEKGPEVTRDRLSGAWPGAAAPRPCAALYPAKPARRSAGESVVCEPGCDGGVFDMEAGTALPSAIEPVARHPLVDEIEHHRSAGLRALPNRNRCLWTYLAGFGLGS